MAPTDITRIGLLPWGMLNAHLVQGQAGCLLVDTGLPGSETRIFAALRSKGLGWKDIRLIVVTHAHIDHAGSTASIRELSGAPVVGHAADLPYFLQQKQMHFCSTGCFGHLFLRTGLIKRPYRPFQPDILLDNNDNTLDLQAYGVGGSLRHTPGHTAGSLSMALSDGNALVGDLVTSGILIGGIVRNGHAKQPPFEDDPHQVGRELLDLLAAGARRFHHGHGAALDAVEVRRHANRLLSGPARPVKALP